VAINNSRILCNKLPLLLIFIEVNNCDILFISETWLKPSVTCSCLIDYGYQLHRDDRHDCLGGGVLILVKNEFASCEVDFIHPDNAHFDICCVDIIIYKSIYRVMCVYRPPDFSIMCRNELLLLCGCMSALMSPKLIYFIAGDFYLPRIDWNTGFGHNNGFHDVFLEFVIDTCLTQIITVPTRLDNLLDLFLTSAPLLVADCNALDPLGASDHNTLVLELIIPTNFVKPTQSQHVIRNRFIIWNTESITKAQNYILAI